MMFLFAGHSAGLLSKNFVKQRLHEIFAQKPSSMAHEGNHICLHRFSFSLHCECLVGGRLYMPNQRCELHHKICDLRIGSYLFLKLQKSPLVSS